jgi:hypothetical protein
VIGVGVEIRLGSHDGVVWRLSGKLLPVRKEADPRLFCQAEVVERVPPWGVPGLVQ